MARIATAATNPVMVRALGMRRLRISDHAAASNSAVKIAETIPCDTIDY
jgi:hypothetical protein